MNPERDDQVLTSPPGTQFAFRVEVEGARPDHTERVLRVTGSGLSGAPLTVEHRLSGADQEAYLDFFADLADAFGTRTPLSRRPEADAPPQAQLQPLLTEPLAPEILYGYGDPSVTRVTEEGGATWWLVVTSNDAPDAFPILRSDDLSSWRHEGFVFPRGQTPAWALTGPGVSDFWAPEMHQVNGEYWVCFAAREHDRSLAIGMARAERPQGPYRAGEMPLVRGGVIDAHIVQDDRGSPWLFWKKDENDVWPGLLCDLLHRRGGVEALFAEAADRRTAALLLTLWPWLRTLEPMEQFFLMQPLIEAVTSEFSHFGQRLHEATRDRPEHAAELKAVQEALKTRIYAQQLAPDGEALLGEPVVVLENDQPWEAHLIEGVWVTGCEGRWYMLYAGNDFSTPHYGIGGAVADHLLGPYRKLDEPLLRSSAEWAGPGHPSVALGPDGRPRMFLHAFFPGTAAYKAFRALLTTPLAFDGESLRVGG